ncbi:endonuclease/exonuclease/phosphatase [Deinococcus koreensis]|uniref:Endonuclease/exonuclease/phosphatase n=2 Tax=Deinococcus koreensis TaxID=2054903 RepID=A0A2K3V2X3_9DEIO|nr:endonuclease/exonuclease/phosphatase [Deinococcus koreensis]
MNRVSSAITVNASGVGAKSNVLVAKVSGLEARLLPSGTQASGELPGVRTGRNLNVLVEGRDSQGILRQQGSATLDLSETDQSVSVALQDLVAQAPVVASVSAPASVKIGDPLSIRVQGSQPAGGDQLASVKIEWGDGSSDTTAVTGPGLDATYPHTYTAAGTQTVTVTLTNTAGLSSTSSTSLKVIDAANPTVNIDLGAEITPVTLNVSGVPADATRVQAVVTAPLGAQTLRAAALKPSYTLELVPRGGGAWGGTLGLPVGSTYGVVIKTITPAGETSSASQPISPSATATSFDLPFAPASACAAPARLTPIAAIQGPGASSPLAGQTVTTRGVVTLDAQAGLSGFFMQSATPDSDPATSDGIFVFTGTTPRAVKAGDLVQVSATVTEFGTTNPVTQLTSLSALDACGAGSVTPSEVPFPLSSATDLERYEGMQIRIPTTLTVTDTFGYGRYGELGLASGGRVFNPTNGQGGSAAGNALRRIVLDDVRSAQNPATLPFLGPDNTRRAGDTVAGLTGTVHYVGGGYRIEPTSPPVFVNANPRFAAPASVGGSLKVAGANVLNYFTQLVTSNSGCTADGTSASSRGATNCAEFLRQQTKVVAALRGLDADVVTLMEVQNNGDSALNNLRDALNTAYGSSVYAAVTTGVIGTDAIKVAMLYKPGRVALERPFMVDTNTVYSRPPLAQTFRELGSGGVFTVVANHFKSKGSCPTSGDVDTGQGCWNQLRVQQAQALLNFVDTIKTQTRDADVLLMGDFNAYGDEDPIKLLTDPAGANFEGLNKRIPADERYSFQFNGEFGYLDHAIASPNLKAQVSGITEWHINADEPVVLDYNVEFKNNPACTSTTCTSPDLYTPDAYRASDHDPVLVGLNLTADAAAPAALSLNPSGAATVVAGQPYTLTLGANKALDSVTVTWGDGSAPETVSAPGASLTHTYATAGTLTIGVSATAGAETATASKPLSVTAAPVAGGTTRLVISQLFGGGGNTGSVYRNDFVELFNAGSADAVLAGRSIQYASAAGAFSAANTYILPAGTPALRPGGYFLVQMAAGTGGTSALPTPDATGSLALGASAGKVALVANGDPSTGKADPDVLDFVGYGAANESEGSPTPVLSATASAQRKAGGCTDTGSNSADFDVLAAAPRNSAAPLNVCP